MSRLSLRRLIAGALIGGTVGFGTTTVAPALWVLTFWNPHPNIGVLFNAGTAAFGIGPSALVGAVIWVRLGRGWRVALYSAFFYLIIIMCMLVCVYFITIYRNPNVSGEIYDIQASKLRAWALIGVPLYVLIGAANGLLIRALYGWFPALFDRPERPGAQRTRRSRPERYDL